MTVHDIRAIKKGHNKAFKLESRNKLVSARSMVSYCNRVKKPSGIKRYIKYADFEELTLYVCAL